MQNLCLSCSEAQRPQSRRSSLEETLTSQPRPRDPPASSTSTSSTTAAGGSARVKPLLDYSFYMATILPKQATEGPAAPSPASQSPQSSPGADKKVTRRFQPRWRGWSGFSRTHNSSESTAASM